MRALLFAPFLILAGSAALAQQPGVAAPEAVAAAPQGPADVDPRVNQLIIYGDDPCPAGDNDEIIVCARLPEEDRYRIPPALREDPNAPATQSWSNRAIELSYAGRSGIGSCTPTGPGGAIGCFNQIVQQRSGAGEQIDWGAMIDEARRERMRRIDAAEAEEAADENSPD